jgi:hypothetical protein
VAVIRVESIRSTTERGPRPNDPWTRLGTIALVDPQKPGEPPIETELVRFITPFGGPADYEQDITTLAPLLHGKGRTISATIATYSEEPGEPGWRLSLELRYAKDGAGARRPVLAERLLYRYRVEATNPKTLGRVTIPEGLATPRLRILTTGHATDGQGGNEFITCTHTLRIDGQVVARWRPWSEGGGAIRDRNPMAGRRTIRGREVRSSDFDRSGWMPGLVVEPVIIPCPELMPGPHRIEIEIEESGPKLSRTRRV